MTKIKKLLKSIVLTVLILCMTMGSLPGRFVHAAEELPNLAPRLYPFVNEEDLKARIINSPEFITNHALFAHYLGFGWCGGTASQYVGEDFDFRKEGDNYVLQARYNPNDPYSDGFWADKRLKMTISNVSFYIAPDTIKTGEEKITQLDPELVQSFVAINRGNTEDKASTTFSYNKSTTVGHSTNFSFQESLNIKHTLKLDVLFLSGSLEYSYGLTAGQSWSDSTSETESTSTSTSYDTTVPAKSKKTIKLMSFKTQSDVPYTANIYMDYDITFSGFLRWGGNARTDHPTDRPFVNVTFGAGDLTAPEEIERIYTNRSIPGYSQWDFAWMENEFGAGNVKSLVTALAKQPLGATIDGKFTCIDGTHVQVIADEAIPLTEDELNDGSNTMSLKSLDPDMLFAPSSTDKGITIDEVRTFDNPYVKIDKTTITTNDDTIVIN